MHEGKHAMIRIITATALVFASFAGTARAETVKVSYADLDLSNQAGVKALNRRVAAAITKVCGEVDPKNLSEGGYITKCRAAAKMSTAQQIASAVNSSERVATNDSGVHVASR
jgi:UrcA family protein